MSYIVELDFSLPRFYDSIESTIYAIYDRITEIHSPCSSSEMHKKFEEWCGCKVLVDAHIYITGIEFNSEEEYTIFLLKWR